MANPTTLTSNQQALKNNWDQKPLNIPEVNNKNGVIEEYSVDLDQIGAQRLQPTTGVVREKVTEFAQQANTKKQSVVADEEKATATVDLS